MALPRTYDPEIDAGRGPVPAAYVRALVRHESNFQPAAKDPRSTARGLLAITRVVREEYNQATGQKVAAADLDNPAVNLAVGLWALRRIVRSLEKHHPASLAPAWQDRRYVEVLTHAWNAGWSERGGVGLVAGKLEAAGRPVTLDTIGEAARAAGASRFVGEPKRIGFARKVAATYFDEIGAPAAPPPPTAPPTSDAPAAPAAPVAAGDEARGPGADPAAALLIGAGIVAAASSDRW